MTQAQSWAATLTADLQTGIYTAQKANWLSGMDLSSPSDSAMIWARDANAYVCSTVIPNGVTAVQNKELDGAYYNSTISVVELQITKGMYIFLPQIATCETDGSGLAGYRLAAWLNLIATGDIGLAAATGPQKREPLSYLPPGETNEFSPAKLARRSFGHVC